MSVRLALKFRERHSQVLQDELDSILAGIQTQLGGFGAYHPIAYVDTQLLMSQQSSGKWTLGSISFTSTRLGYATYGELMYLNVNIATSTVSNANNRLQLQLPNNLRIRDDTFIYAPVLFYSRAAGTHVPGIALVDGRPTSGNNPALVYFTRQDGAVWSTVAGDLDVYATITFPFIRV